MKNKMKNESKILDLLHQAIEQEEAQTSSPNVDRRSLDISDALKCRRMRWLKYNNYPRSKFTVKSLMNFMLGRVTEKVLVNYLKTLGGIVIKKQMYLIHYLDSRIRGKLDIILNLGKIKVVEVKSQDAWQFWKKGKDEAELSSFFEAQCANYIDILQHHGEDVDDKGVILEVSRDTFKMRERDTRDIKDLREKLHDDWQELILAIDEDKIPPVLDTYPDDWQCKYCGVSKACEELQTDKEK